MRCGHIGKGKMIYCGDSKFNRVTRRRNKCPAMTGKIALASDLYCGEAYCCLSVYEGRWICHECHFGYKPGEVNRRNICAKGGCSHVVCWTCQIRNEENIRAMYQGEESVDENELEESINEDTSMDSIVFEPSEEEEEQDEDEYVYEQDSDSD